MPIQSAFLLMIRSPALVAEIEAPDQIRKLTGIENADPSRMLPDAVHPVLGATGAGTTLTIPQGDVAYPVESLQVTRNSLVAKHRCQFVSE